jgi:RNA polymerase sigma factor (sigma-70 family)
MGEWANDEGEAVDGVAAEGPDEARDDRDRAFDELFRSTYVRAVTVARRIVGDEAEAVAAEAFTRAYDRWPRIQNHPAVDAWVLRVTINLAIDQSRRRARTGLAPTSSAFDDETATRVALAAALRALPEKQRQAIALRYLADCEEATIATALHIRPGTVKTHLKRGLDRLRTQLGTDQELTDDAFRTAT